MTLLKTKEAALQLAVSETTIRRWVSLFPSSFHKDMFGHYIFDEQAIDKLRRIKIELEEGTILHDIKLAPLNPLLAGPYPVTEFREPETLLIRINRLEASLSNKADEVVSFQLLHHRKELEDMRHTLSQLVATMEMLQTPLLQQSAAIEQMNTPPISAGNRRKRRGVFRILFPFL